MKAHAQDTRRTDTENEFRLAKRRAYAQETSY